MGATVVDPTFRRMLDAVAPPARAQHLDALRGLAVSLMVVDHLALAFGVLPLRLTLGRLAMPLFFILAGHLSRRVGPRTLWALALGLALPALAPWIDSPNVLAWYAAGVGALAAARYLRLPLWLLLALPLTLAANGWGSPVLTGYNPLCLLGLMALGAMLPRASFDWARRLPAPLAVLGRYPLTVYVGHVLALTWLTASL